MLSSPGSEFLTPGNQVDEGSPRIVHVPASANGSGIAWLAEHIPAVVAMIQDSGAVLLRGLGVADADDAEQVGRQLVNVAFHETEHFSRRRRHRNTVVSALEWPADQPMCAHHEQSYALTVPATLIFCCLTPPEHGGETGVADSGAIYAALPAAIVEPFQHQGWMLVRNYSDEIGLPWPEAFGTDDPSVVQAYCAANAIDTEWRTEGRLRTRQRRRAVVVHPVTGRPTWFNQAAFFNEWTLAPEVREYLVDVYGADELPFNTFYGNGDPIGPQVIQEINDISVAMSRQVKWQAGDVLVLDNLRQAHSREPFEGPREILVVMGNPVRVATF